MKFTIDITEEKEGRLRVGITCDDGAQCILVSPFFTNVGEKRFAISNFYSELGRMMQERQFPDHTIQYKLDEAGRAMCIGYPATP